MCLCLPLPWLCQWLCLPEFEFEFEFELLLELELELLEEFELELLLELLEELELELPADTGAAASAPATITEVAPTAAVFARRRQAPGCLSVSIPISSTSVVVFGQGGLSRWRLNAP